MLVFWNVSVAARLGNSALLSLSLPAARFRHFACLLILLASILPAPALPQEDAWSVAANEFVAKVLAVVRPSKVIALHIEVSAPMPASATSRVREGLEAGLRCKDITVRPEADDEIRVRLAESSTSLLWVAEVQIEGEVRTVFLEVPRSVVPRQAAEVQVALRTRRIWQQGTPLLFAGEMLRPGSAEMWFILLTHDELIQLSALSPDSTVVRQVTLPRRTPRLRAEEATAEATAQGVKTQFTKEACWIPWEESAEAKCSPTPAPVPATLCDDEECRAFLAGNEAGPARAVNNLPCASGRLFLQAGTGDWTTPDKLEAHVKGRSGGQSTVEGIGFTGPILSLTNGLGDGRFLAVVKNLKTNRYEVHAIVAVCEQ